MGNDRRKSGSGATSTGATSTGAPSTPAASRGQRALWTFLGATLIGPFVGSLLGLLGGLGLAAALKGVGVTLASVGAIAPLLVHHAVELYVWAAMPAALAGAVCATWLIRRGDLPWLVPTAAAAIMATVVNALTRFSPATTGVAFIAAVSALIVWIALVRARILPSSA